MLVEDKLIPTHQPAHGQTCILYFACCSVWHPCPNVGLSPAVIHTIQSRWLLQHSQPIQIFFFLSLSPLINKACPAEKIAGTKAHRLPQFAPQAPSRASLPRAGAGGRALTAQSPPGPRVPQPPSAEFCPSCCRWPFTCERYRCKAMGSASRERRGGAGGSERRNPLSFPPLPARPAQPISAKGGWEPSNRRQGWPQCPALGGGAAV